MALGFTGATSAPGLSCAPDGSAVSLLPGYVVRIPKRAKGANADALPPVKRDIYVSLNAPAEAEGKPVEVYVRGLVHGRGELVVDLNGEQESFACELQPPPEGDDLPVGSDIDVVHLGKAHVGENVLRLTVSLAQAGNDPADARFGLDMIDIALDGADPKSAPVPQPLGR